ncbi:VRR-NUC domain-containing protein [Cronobacter sakazakii]|nr:VRR-NUC domain-containing protein [Cronobacter sakazakii]EGT4325727.1 VRR-NUC domain-containing protein [Cronobacter sakazakii]EGT4364789.1 VRR-NUC domain-containing protein [Cronobacter sakazakii]
MRPDVLNFHGREALSEPYEWRVEFTAPQSDLAPDEVLLKYASLSMLSGRVVYGVITRFEWLGTSADQTHYAVTLASRLALLSLTRRCAVYQNLSVPELLEQILRAQGLEGPDFDFRLERSYPQRELITQWRETDLAFIQRILSEVGKGIYRRPDVIIVKDKQDRWPGLAGPDHDDPPGMHGDNLARLVEVKFPGDKLLEDQFDEYMHIVGDDATRMTILEIHDCRPQEKQWVDQVVNVTMKAWQTSGAKYWPLFLYPPIFMPRPPSTPVAARMEPWTYAGQAVASLSDGVIRGVAEGWSSLSKETQQLLNSTAGWLNDSGEWIYRQGSEVWIWASKTGKAVKSWSNVRIKAAWAEIQYATDMTLDLLKQVDWVQILTNVAKTVGVILVAICVGALVVTLGIPEAIISAFLLIIRLAITAWETLVTILGGGAGAAALGAG